MKKVLSMFLTFVLLLSASTSFGEDFTLRNGIIFGESPDAIRQKETLGIDESRTSTAEDGTTSVLYSNKGTVAGFSSTRVDYHFKNNALTEVFWMIDMPNKDHMISAYHMLKDSLSQKYGAPLGNTNGVYHPVHGSATQFRSQDAWLYALLGEKFGILDYDEWVFEYATGKSMKIELVQDYVSGDKGTQYWVLVSYTYFENQTIENVQTNIMNDI